MLTTDVLEGDWDKYVEAKVYTLLANSYKNTDDKERVLRLALDKQPKFLDAWYGLLDIRLNNENLSSEDAFKFSQEIISGFKYYPMVMDDLLREITLSGKITETNHLGGFYIERQSALEEAYSLRKNEKDLTAEDYAKTRQPWVAGDVARAILDKDHSRIASFSFDKARYISKLEYVPSKGCMNGQRKKIDVYGSNDGTNWTRILENKELSRDKNAKEIELNSQEAYQYIKIQGLESYGNSENEKDMYFCGSELNFYEDTTKQLNE